MVNLEQREEVSKKVLVMFSEPGINSITASDVSERFDITYPCALGILFDLTLAGYLTLDKRKSTRLFYLNREKFLPKRAVLLKEA
jgi:hypothetical protein